jgi:hypothetical protein
MTFSTYSDLQTNIASWIARDDLTSNIPDFITLAEAWFARNVFKATRLQEVTATLTPSGGSVALPSDYLESVRLTWTGSPRIELEYVHPSILQAMYPTAPTDVPHIWTIEGGNILIRPEDTTALELLYYAKPAALSGSLNWLYTNYPDAYLAASLAEAYAFLKDTDNFTLWATRRDQKVGEIKSNQFHQGSGLTIRVFGATP